MTADSSLRLLIIDDHAVVREGLEAMLGIDPCFEAIATAGSTEEALPYCENFRPHVILLDLKMPGSDGFNALEIIRQRWPEIRVIILSASATAAEVKLARRNGAAGYLGKSSDRATLLKAIRNAAAGATVFPIDPAPHRPAAPPSAPANWKSCATSAAGYPASNSAASSASAAKP